MVGPQIFNARDNELLLAMPIKPSVILTSRLTGLLIVEYVFTAVIIIPAFIVLIISGYAAQLPALGYVFFFLSALLMPLIALALGCLIGWLVALATSRMRGKNVIMLLLSLVFLTAYFIIFSRLNDYMGTLIERGAEMADAVRRALFPAYHLGISVVRGSLPSFLIFAACAIAPFVLMCALLSRSFVKITTAARGAKKVEYREKSLRASGARAALLRIELRRLWSMPMYILNASLGAIAMLALAGILIIYPNLIIGGIPIELLSELSPDADLMLLGVLSLTVLTTVNSVSAPSISLEGKHLWIPKSLPVPAFDILLAKVGLHVFVCGVPALLAGIACLIALPVNSALMAVLLFALPLLSTLMIALFGITLNLAFPRFDWINPIQPVKQGLSTMLTLFGAMALIAALAIICYALMKSDILTLRVYLLLCAALFLALSCGLFAYLKSAGCRKFEML